MNKENLPMTFENECNNKKILMIKRSWVLWSIAWEIYSTGWRPLFCCNSNKNLFCKYERAFQITHMLLCKSSTMMQREHINITEKMESSRWVEMIKHFTKSLAYFSSGFRYIHPTPIIMCWWHQPLDQLLFFKITSQEMMNNITLT